MKKKIFTTLFLVLFVSASFAQIRTINGNVGVGTSNPQHKLDVDGDVRISGSINNTDAPITFRVGNIMAGTTGGGGHGNVSFGIRALHNLSGSGNTAIGANALGFNSIGSYNTAIGANALGFNSIGSHNIAVGSGAHIWNHSSSHNTVIGNHAFSQNQSGSHNTVIGNSALADNLAGSRNTAIGANTSVGIGVPGGDAFTRGAVVNVTVIGYGARATAPNQVRIGNSNVSSIGGQVAWSNLSDGRAKRNIRAEVPGLEFINLLQPVVYNVNLDVVDELMGIDRAENERIMLAEFEMLSGASELSNEERTALAEQQQIQSELLEQERAAREIRQNQLQTGFVAQDVRRVAESIGFDFSGVDVDEMGIYGLRYAEFVVPLVRAVQELSRQNEQMQTEIEQLRTELRALQGGIIGIPAPPPIQTMSAPAPASSNDWTSFDETTSDRTAALYQNVPNPFGQTTKIRYYLPQNVATASLAFFDLQGRQIKQITLTQRGEGEEFISGSQFAPGIYIYALIADGQAVAVKQMIITE